MKLSDLPRRVVRPLGEWENFERPTAATQKERALARWRRYATKNREKRIRAMRDYRERKAA